MSYGINLGLEKAGINVQAANILLGALSGFAKAAGVGGTAGGITGTATDWAKSLLGGIADTAKKFGSMIVSGVQNVISFAKKVTDNIVGGIDHRTPSRLYRGTQCVRSYKILSYKIRPFFYHVIG